MDVKHPHGPTLQILEEDVKLCIKQGYQRHGPVIKFGTVENPLYVQFMTKTNERLHVPPNNSPIDWTRIQLNRTLDDLKASGKYCPDIYDQAINASLDLIFALREARQAQLDARKVPRTDSPFSEEEIRINKAAHAKNIAELRQQDEDEKNRKAGRQMQAPDPKLGT